MIFSYSDYVSRQSGLMYFLCLIIQFPILLALAVFRNNMPEQLYLILSLSFPLVLMFFVAVSFSSGLHLRPILGLRGVRTKSDVVYVPILLLGICLYAIGTYMSLVFSLLFPEDVEASQSTQQMLISLGFGKSWLIIALLPAIVEEFICRGVIFHVFRHRSLVAGIVVSSLSFAFLHLSMQSFGYALLIGAAFALICEITGSLFPSMLLHMLFNTVSLRFSFASLMRPAEQTEGTALTLSSFFTNYWYITLLALIVCVFCIFLYKWMMKICDYKLSKDVNIDYPPVTLGYIITWILCILITCLSSSIS